MAESMSADEVRLDVKALAEELEAVAFLANAARAPHYASPCSAGAAALLDMSSRLAAAEQRIGELEAMVGELADDVEAGVENEWNPNRAGVHPANAHRYERDMALPRRARALLSTPDSLSPERPQ